MYIWVYKSLHWFHLDWSLCLRYNWKNLFQKIVLHMVGKYSFTKNNDSTKVHQHNEWEWFWVAGKNVAISWKFTNQWFSIHSKSIYGLQKRVYRYVRVLHVKYISELILTFSISLSFLSCNDVGIDGNKTFIHIIFFYFHLLAELNVTHYVVVNFNVFLFLYEIFLCHFHYRSNILGKIRRQWR